MQCIAHVAQAAEAVGWMDRACFIFSKCLCNHQLIGQNRGNPKSTVAVRTKPGPREDKIKDKKAKMRTRTSLCTNVLVYSTQ